MADPRIDPCVKCGTVPEVSWECSDPPRVLHSETTCEAMQKVRNAIDAWNVKQREATSGLPF